MCLQWNYMKDWGLSEVRNCIGTIWMATVRIGWYCISKRWWRCLGKTWYKIDEEMSIWEEMTRFCILGIVRVAKKARSRSKDIILADGYLESNYSHSIWRQSPLSFCLLKNPSTFVSFACHGFDFSMSTELYKEALMLYSLPEPRCKYVYASAKFISFLYFSGMSL